MPDTEEAMTGAVNKTITRRVEREFVYMPDRIAKATNNEEAGVTTECDKPVPKSSGKTRKFETGAHRDSAEGKGRCDLIPMDVVQRLENSRYALIKDDETWHKGLFSYFATLQHNMEVGLTDDYSEVFVAMFYEWCYITHMTAYDWYLEVAHLYEAGANKYGENNWKKGMPLKVYFDSMLRHYIKYCRGDKDERHDRAFVWNLFGMFWTYINKPKGSGIN